MFQPTSRTGREEPASGSDEVARWTVEATGLKTSCIHGPQAYTTLQETEMRTQHKSRRDGAGIISVIIASGPRLCAVRSILNSDIAKVGVGILGEAGDVDVAGGNPSAICNCLIGAI